MMEDRWISRALKECNGLVVRLARCEEYTIVLDRTVGSQIGQMRRLVLGLLPWEVLVGYSVKCERTDER